ncbi:MAG: hypothetical protein HC769_16030 [Cyanobacteria bacterium CRU_2_1]|nr:hypothetical protein [Cyanobacteria bacterium RU_5_0]NJR60206.1 hypothetical protein [Cyanobacteria bacterium CRU_2_1]
MENINVEDFELYLNWAVSILKTQDLQVIRTFKHEIVTRLEPEYMTNILIAALHHLAEDDPDTFNWALHNYDPEFYIEVRYRTVVAAVRQLVRRGMIPGRDFSSIPLGGLIVTPQVRAILWQNTSTFSAVLLQEILHTFKRV